MSRILIAGCGYVGMTLSRRLAQAGDEVWALRRNPAAVPPSVTPIRADLCEPRTLMGLPDRLNCVVYLVSAAERSDDAYRLAYVVGLRNLIHALAKSRPSAAVGQNRVRFLFASSTSVYGERNGAWVDESTPVEPSHFSGRRLLEGEQQVLHADFLPVVVRFGGIYGPGRASQIADVRLGRARCVQGPPSYTNRIHLEDCAGVLQHLARLENPRTVYLAVDHEPTERCEFLRWLANRLQVPPPRLEAAQTQPGTASRGNKRCRNTRLLTSGYCFEYPTYREGYQATLDLEQSPTGVPPV